MALQLIDIYLTKDVESHEELSEEVFILERWETELVVLSTIVAAVGMLRNNVAVVIGAMVIAPLIGPNMAYWRNGSGSDSLLWWPSACL